MNDKLLLKKTVNIDNVQFLQFIHPDFDIVCDIYAYDNPCPSGIIYVGKTVEDLSSILNSKTSNWIVVNTHYFDVDLSTNDGLLKNILPIQYMKLLKSSKDKYFSVNKLMSYDECLEKIKVCLIDGSAFTIDSDKQVSVYDLFKSVLLPPNTFENIYFNTVTKDNINIVSSSVLSFLTRVLYKDLPKSNPHYARIITDSNIRYGKYIKHAVYKYVTSKSKKEIALFQLLSFLNRVR